MCSLWETLESDGVATTCLSHYKKFHPPFSWLVLHVLPCHACLLLGQCQHPALSSRALNWGVSLLPELAEICHTVPSSVQTFEQHSACMSEAPLPLSPHPKQKMDHPLHRQISHCGSDSGSASPSAPSSSKKSCTARSKFRSRLIVLTHKTKKRLHYTLNTLPHTLHTKLYIPNMLDVTNLSKSTITVMWCIFPPIGKGVPSVFCFFHPSGLQDIPENWLPLTPEG